MQIGVFDYDGEKMVEGCFKAQQTLRNFLIIKVAFHHLIKDVVAAVPRASLNRRHALFRKCVKLPNAASSSCSSSTICVYSLLSAKGLGYIASISSTFAVHMRGGGQNNN